MAELEKLLNSYLPMTESSFLILSSVVPENHGYGIMLMANRRTNGRVNLGAGTVYTLLYRMEADGLICSVREDQRRKVYGITSLGMQVLQAEIQRLEQSVAIGNEALKAMEGSKLPV